MDWTNCPDVERVPGRVSGAWVVKGTRIMADAVIENAADGFTAEEISQQIYEGLPVDRARRLIEYARRHGSRAA